MKQEAFQAAFNRICQETWDEALKETPEIAEDCTLEDFKTDVRIELEVLIDLGLIKVEEE